MAAPLNETPRPPPAGLEASSSFPAFPEDDAAVVEVSTSQEAMREDPMGRRFPRPRHVTLFLFAASLCLYLSTLSWTAFPGQPTRALLRHLKMEAAPATQDLLWGWGVRAAAKLPGLPVAAWMGVFAALCGALAVALLGRLMVRVGYVVRSEPGPASLRREAQARRLSGLVAGLYLACTVPFWVVSTRSLPDSFYVLALVAAAWCFSQYQFGGKRRYLFALGLVFGAGVAEFATFLLFLPLATFLVVREWLRWQALRRWSVHGALWAGLGLGLSLYAFHAIMLYRQGLWAELYASPWQALLQIWREQVMQIAMVRFSPGFLVLAFFSVVPWLILFAMSSRSPWFYEWGQVLPRVVLAGALLGVLFNAPFSPWRLMGMGQLVVTPYLVLAICMGYMAGEFWILGEVHYLLDFRRDQVRGRRLASACALLIPVAILAAGVRNWSEADGRPGRILRDVAVEVLDSLDGGSVLFSAGVLDDPLRLAIRESFAPVVQVSMSRIPSRLYVRQLARSFRTEALQEPLRRGHFDRFFENLMMAEAGTHMVAFIDMPDLFREYGYLVPNGLLYRLQPDEPGGDELAAAAAVQRMLWERALSAVRRPPPEANPASAHLRALGLVASRAANNMGVMLARKGDLAGAAEAFRAAWRLHSDNASALLNLLAAAEELDLDDRSFVESAWLVRMDALGGERWAMSVQFGNVWDARRWLRRGWPWALTGEPAVAEASRLHPPPAPSEEDAALETLLAKAYLQWGKPPRDKFFHRAQLARDVRSAADILALARLALAQRDFEQVDSLLDEARAAGLDEDELLFDRAMILHVRGDRVGALDALERLSSFFPGDPRVWAALVLLADGADPRQASALRILRQHRRADVSARLVLGAYYLERGLWEEAGVEIEKAIQLEPRTKLGWELMLVLARETANRRLMQSAMRILTDLDPTQATRFQNEGVELYRKGDLDGAERKFREGIRIYRDPALLNNLAHVLNRRGGQGEEALMLVNEALRREPGSPSMLNTRAEILLSMGRLGEARRDVVEALRRRGTNCDPLLNLIVAYHEAGDRGQAERLLRVAEGLRERLDAVQRVRLDALLRSVRVAPPEADSGR